MVLNKMKRYSTSPVMGNVLHLLHLQVGFPGGSEGSVCLQCRRPRFDPWGRKWQLTLVLRLGKSHGWRSLVGYGPWGCNELDTTKQLHFTPCKTVGEANSCFESNPIPARDTQIQFWLSLCVVSGSWCAQGLFEPSECLCWLCGLILNVILPLLPPCWGSP